MKERATTRDEQVVEKKQQRASSPSCICTSDIAVWNGTIITRISSTSALYLTNTFKIREENVEETQHNRNET